MTGNHEQSFQRKIGCERAMLMLPFNVVLAARIRGEVQPASVQSALEKLRVRHPLLGVRVQMEPNDSATFVGDNVPAVAVNVDERQDDRQWLTRVQRELRTSFDLSRGPLVRCALLQSAQESDIILCAHHAICDGMSLGYLLRDLLTLVAASEQVVGEQLMPPAVDPSNVPTPPKSNWLMRLIMNTINRTWAAKGIRFSDTDVQRMHERFWQSNGTPEVLAWNLERDLTARLVQRCREEKVTVNSVLWTAFLAAQNEVLAGRTAYRDRCAMAVNTRDKLRSSAGETFGFFASSLTVKPGFSPEKPFWDSTRSVHAAINRELKKTDLFRMLVSDMIHPTLLDSLYFQKYGIIDESIPAKFLRKMGWDKITFGFALTNVGRFGIPTTYGSLRIEEVYGPLFYSDVEEQMVGVITVNGRLTFLMAVNRSIGNSAEKLRESVVKTLHNSVVQGTDQ